MINTRLKGSLEIVIENWMDENCKESFWESAVGYVSNDCAARLAKICILTLEESRLAQELRNG